MVTNDMVKGLVAPLVTFFTSFAGQAIWPFLEDGIRDGSEKMTSTMFGEALEKLQKNPAAVKWLSWGVRGLGSAIDFPLPDDLFVSAEERIQAEEKLNRLLEAISSGGADALVGSDIGDLPDDFTGLVPVVARVKGLGYLGRYVHTAVRVDDQAACTCPAVHEHIDESLLTNKVMDFLSKRNAPKRGRNAPQIPDTPQFGHSVDYIDYDTAMNQLSLQPCPHCMGVLPEPSKKVKAAFEQLSRDAHTKLHAVLEELRWRDDGGHEDSFFIRNGMNRPAPAKVIKAIEDHLATMNLVGKDGDKDGIQRRYTGVDNPDRIGLVVQSFRGLLEPEGSLNTARVADVADRMNIWTRVVNFSRGASDSAGDKLVQFARGDGRSVVFGLIALFVIGFSMWVSGIVLLFATDLHPLISIGANAFGGLFMAIIPWSLGYLIQGGIDLAAHVADVSTKLGQVAYVQLEKLTGDSELGSEQERGKHARNTGIGIALIILVETGLILTAMFNNWILGYDHICMVAMASAFLFFFYAAPSTVAASGWVDRDPNSWYGSIFAFKQARGTARFFAVMARVAMVGGAVALVPIYAMLPNTPASNFGYTPQYGLSDEERAFLVTDYQDRVWVSESPAAKAQAAGTLVPCDDARGVGTVCLPRGAKVLSVDEQGRKWKVRWNGTPVVSTPKDLEVDDVGAAVLTAKVKEHGPKSVFGAVFKGLHVHWSIFVLGLIVLIVLCFFFGGSLVSLAWGLLSNDDNAWVKGVAGGAGTVAGVVALILLVCVMVFYPLLANIYVAANWTYDTASEDYAEWLEEREKDANVDETIDPTNNETEDNTPVASDSPTQTGSLPERSDKAKQFWSNLERLEASLE